MITAFSVKIPEKKTGVKGLARRLRRDKVDVTVQRARGVSLRHVIYTSYSGEVRLERTDKAVGEQRSQLLCSEKLIFPHRSGYKRFYSGSFPARLCANFALAVLRECTYAQQLRLGIFDPRAVAAELVLKAPDDICHPLVITENFEPYELARDRALHENGAAMTVTHDPSGLEHCDLVIAPTLLDVTLPLRRSAVLLTAGEPRAEQYGECYYRYSFRMPNGFDAIKPMELSAEYFCSALYTLGSQYELGSIVPLSCSGKTGSQTAKSLANLLDIHVKKAYNK